MNVHSAAPPAPPTESTAERPGPGGPPTRHQDNRDTALVLAERFGLLAILLAIVVVFWLMNDIFMSWSNWQNIIASQGVTLIIALALMVPLVAGNFDLSVGSVAILSSIVTAGAMQNNHTSLGLACAYGIAAGVIVGVVNGILVTKLRLNALIATLGTSVIIAGLIDQYTGGNAIVNGISTKLTDFGSGTVGGISQLAIVALVLSVLIAYLLTKTPYGRKLFAIGSSEKAAELVGIRVGRVVFLSFVASGALAAIGGVLMLAQQGSGNPATNGISVLLPALAAVYLGASTLYPGQFNVPGTILGLIVVAVIVSGLTLQGVAPWVQPVATGTALIVAVGASQAFRRRRT
jgi:ribose transport system permease protein